MTLQTVPTQRRREILTALTTLMPAMFPFFVQTLRTNWQLFRAEVQPRSSTRVNVLNVLINTIDDIDVYSVHNVSWERD